MATEYVAFDFETTGVDPGRNHIIEIGAVRFSSEGVFTREFNSLVRPIGKVSASEIHGIREGDVLGAPSFSEILPTFVEFIDGAVLVAHNATFDIGFLESELSQLGIHDSEVEAICTMRLFGSMFPSGPRRLVECLEFFGIEVGAAHQALDDAQMTAKLATRLMKEQDGFGIPNPPKIDLPIAAFGKRKALLPRISIRAQVEERSGYLSSLIDKLPGVSGNGGPSALAVSEYLNLLEKVLVDLEVNAQEADDLFDLADSYGLTRSEIHTLHVAFFSEICKVAVSDGFISKKEQQEIESVANILRIVGWEELLKKTQEVVTNSGVRKISTWSKGLPSYATSSEVEVSDSEFMNCESITDFDSEQVRTRLSGKSVVITGEFREFSREQGKQAIVQRGGKCTSSICSKTFDVVVGDSAGPSKLEKVSELNLPVLDINGFRNLLDTGLLNLD